MSSEVQYTGPLPYFDYHLKTLEESYIQYFQERVRIEETYVDSLRRLQQKQHAMDTYRDDRSDRGTSLRKAWREIGDNADRELQTRDAFLENLRTHILSPLLSLKETQDRTRKRIKEDLKMSTETHMEYAENVLPRLKRNYLKKCQEVEDYKSERSATTPSAGTDQSENPLTKVASGPQIGSPMPIRPLNRHPSTHQPSGSRARSPSTSTSLSDLAHQGKKQFNSIVSFLNTEGSKNGGVKEMLSGRPEAAIKGVRAKREADEADKEYRKGVHWLETLRLRRVKILESGYHSVELFVSESADTMKKVLVQYMDSLMATSSTIMQLTGHVEGVIKAISPQDDTRLLAARLQKTMASEIPRPVLYFNYMVGECKDLIFGVALVHYAMGHNLPDGAVPRIVDLCVREIEARGMETEGIYRISGRVSNVQELKVKIERDERSFKFNHTVDDVACVASLLKLYLRELPDPVFRFPYLERIQHSEKREEHIANNFPLVRSKLRRLPPVHQATLRCILEHLSRVQSRAKTNKMDAKNLAIVFGGVIFGEDELPKAADILTMQTAKDTVMEDLIVHAPSLFNDKALSQAPPAEPPLPPAPSGTPKLKIDYGSAYTKTHILPPRSSESQDFTPTLPPRPEQSIHPSRRANPLPSRPEAKDRQDERPDLIDQPPVESPLEHLSSSNVESSTVEPSLEDIREDFEPVQELEVNIGTGKSDQQSPKTPDTFTTAASSPTDTPHTDRTSRPSSRPSTGRGPSPERGLP